MSNNSIQPIDRTLLGAITLGQSGPGSNGNEEVVSITQSSSITGTSPFNVKSKTLIEGWGFYPSAEMQSVYSTYGLMIQVTEI